MIGAIKRSLLGLLPPGVAGILLTWRIRQLIHSYSLRVVEHRYGGGLLRVYLADPLAKGWYDHDWPELPEITALRPGSLRQGARIFDVGAHQGVVALMLAREVGPSGRVVAVEPSPHNFMAAKRNRELNSMNQIELVQAAVSDHAGTLVFNQQLNCQLDDGTGAAGEWMSSA